MSDGSVRWTLRRDESYATCRIEPHPLGVELIVEVDHDVMLTQVHRHEAHAESSLAAAHAAVHLDSVRYLLDRAEGREQIH